MGHVETASLVPVLLALGGLFLAGLLADAVGRRTALPRVTLLLACGIAAGGGGLDLIPQAAQDWYGFLSVTALTMVAFLLGGALDARTLAAHGRAILAVSLAIVGITLLLVAAGLWALGLDPATALVLGAIATATAPAATEDAIRQSGCRGGFVDTLRGIVAIDDAWGMVAFALAVVVAQALLGANGGHMLAEAAWEIGGALALGGAIGLPAAALTGRLSPGEPLQTEALGLVFLTAGLAIWLEVSFLLAGMTVGAVIVNRARHHERAFHEIEHIQWPFMLLFFILAGASLDPESLVALGALGAGYAALRIAARLGGGWLGARLGGAPARERWLYGPALLPQAGVAVGMALVAAQEFPERAEMILTLTIGTTVFFELIGPAATILAVRRATRAGD
ncbi:cation:proton antiporter [Rhodosalinus halophilus]|uniref:Cation:proton antiporter n=1 Tax=Rhodosalinus halophilus TaxID=2259333 RepID=A0A365UAU6_9RHOB|nr:cation:proton antiporter [Rhodosalinus halophilus]RBI86343.1 cation:proton antiporter [Rhodosalinus halophilus]